MDSYERRKKKDKAREKRGQPSQKHVRAYERIVETKMRFGQAIPSIDKK